MFQCMLETLQTGTGQVTLCLTPAVKKHSEMRNQQVRTGEESPQSFLTNVTAYPELDFLSRIALYLYTRTQDENFLRRADIRLSQ